MFTEGLCNFIYRTNYDDIPGDVIKAAKPAILDYIAVAMAGSQEPSGKIVGEMVKESQSPPEATVIGGRFKANCALAALANGTSSHVQDYDDCLDFPNAGLAHPTTGTFSGLLTMGEKYHMTGKDLLTAYCLGVEAYGKIGLLVSERGVGGGGWEPTGILGGMGATAALSKLLKLDEHKMMMAFGIASTMSCSLIRNFGSMAGHLHGGVAARNGIEAVILAQKGYTATYPGIIEGPGGYYNAFSGKSEPLPEEKQKQSLDTLGNSWNLVNPGLMFKYYPCAHISHFGAYAGQQLRAKHAIDWRQIEEIEFRLPHVLGGKADPPDPQNGVQGRFSLAYCLCRSLIHGEIEFAFFTDEAINDPDTRNLMRKIKWAVIQQKDLPGPFGYQEIVLKMKDGHTYSCKVDHPKGEPQNPQSPEEHAAKFRKCALYAKYSDATIAQIKEMVDDFENLKDVAGLTALLGQ
ncbi:MAG: MmgE/PrpD family protein [Dehalococcoidales bacterium]|nr:MmgE/PrpD family protein [Dehalococcoidales bacterium]